MSVHLFTVTFQSQSEIPADSMVNTWHFEGSGSDPVNVADMLTDFYDAVPTGQTTSIAEKWSSQVLSGNYTIRGYDLADPKPRAPIYEVTRTLTELPSTQPLPTEVAVCMSYHSALASGVPAGRRRGRVYLGGWNENQQSGGRPLPAVRATVAAAGRDLIQASNASVSWEWQQYSPTTGEGNIVVGGWCDDAWDTQRRRGQAATTRTSFTGGTP